MKPAPKSLGIAYVFLIFLGLFGAHRLYLRRYVTAVAIFALAWCGALIPIAWAFLWTLGAAVVWLIVDAFLLPGLVRSTNARLANEAKKVDTTPSFR